MTTITKKDLARSVADTLGCKNNLTLQMVDSLFEAMRETLTKGTASKSGDSASSKSKIPSLSLLRAIRAPARSCTCPPAARRTLSRANSSKKPYTTPVPPPKPCQTPAALGPPDIVGNSSRKIKSRLFASRLLSFVRWPSAANASQRPRRTHACTSARIRASNCSPRSNSSASIAI